MKTVRTNFGSFIRSRGRLLVLGGLVSLSTTVSLGQTQPQEPAAQPPQTLPPLRQSDAPLVINTDLVTVIISVTDREGRHVSGLDQKAFTVYDDKVPQQIKFFSDADTPISLAVIFDISSSMSGDKIMRARAALAQFVKTSHRSDEYFLISFSDRAQLLLDGTRDADALLEKFTYVRPHGETALYDATYLGVEKVAQGSRPRQAILLITDGNDTGSRYTFKELRRSLQESDVVVYAIGILAFSRSEARRGRTILKELASVTGGIWGRRGYSSLSGYWIYDPFIGGRTFLPFYYGWSSPYGRSYSTGFGFPSHRHSFFSFGTSARHNTRHRSDHFSNRPHSGRVHHQSTGHRSHGHRRH